MNDKQKLAEKIARNFIWPSGKTHTRETAIAVILRDLQEFDAEPKRAMVAVVKAAQRSREQHLATVELIDALSTLHAAYPELLAEPKVGTDNKV